MRKILGFLSLILTIATSWAGNFNPSSLIPNGEGGGKSWDADSSKGAQVSLDVTTENPKTSFMEGPNNTEGEHVLVGFAVWCNKTPVIYEAYNYRCMDRSRPPLPT